MTRARRGDPNLARARRDDRVARTSVSGADFARDQSGAAGSWQGEGHDAGCYPARTNRGRIRRPTAPTRPPGGVSS